MEPDDKNLLERIAAFGIKNPQEPTSAELQTLLNAALKRQELNVKAFLRYVDLVKIPSEILLKALAGFSTDQRIVTGKTLDILMRSVEVFDKELARDLPVEDRARIREQIITWTDHARVEAQKDRDFREKLVYAGVTTVLIAVGGAMFMFTKGRDKSILLKGVEMARKLR